MLRMIKPVQFL